MPFVLKSGTATGMLLFGLAACSESGPSWQAGPEAGTGGVGTDAAAGRGGDGGGGGAAGAQGGMGGGGADADAVRQVVSGIVSPVIDAEAWQNSSLCVGAVVSVVTEGNVVVLGYGAPEAGGATPPDGDTIFQIGSISKMITGLGLARLVSEGEVAADGRVGSYLAPGLAAPLTNSTFTMAHLVSHHAGFPAMPSNLDPDADPLSPAAGYSRELLRTFLEGFSPPPPPANYQYSNLGLGLLGTALTDHLGVEGYHAVLRELVTDDLGMTSTWGQIGAIGPSELSRVAQGYATQGGHRVVGALADMGVLAGAGGIATTGNDMAKLLQAVTGLTSTALDSAAELAVQPVAAGPAGREIGYAIEIEHRADGDVFLKGGNTSSYTAFVTYRRNPKIGVAIMTNCGMFQVIADLAGQVLDELASEAR